MRKIQIGIMGSAEDLNYSAEAIKFAKELGKEIAIRDAILVYGAEKEYSSLSTNAAMAASENGGITIGGGSGRLTEMAIAYQANIPVICISKFQGWSKKMTNKYFDERKRLKCLEAKPPKEAVELAISSVNIY